MLKTRLDPCWHVGNTYSEKWTDINPFRWWACSIGYKTTSKTSKSELIEHSGLLNEFFSVHFVLQTLVNCRATPQLLNARSLMSKNILDRILEHFKWDSWFFKFSKKFSKIFQKIEKMIFLKNWFCTKNWLKIDLKWI